MAYANSSSLAIRLINSQTLIRKFVEQDYGDVQKTSIVIFAHIFKNTNYCLDKPLWLSVKEIRELKYKVKIFGSTEWTDICREKEDLRYIIIFVKIRGEYLSGERWGHLTALLIDNMEKKIVYFEPNGSVADWNIDIEDFLRSVLPVYFPNYNFIGIMDYCPSLGPQQLESGSAICAAHSLFFIWAASIDPDFNEAQFIGELIKQNRTELRILIEKFIQFIYRYAEENGIFDFYELYQDVEELIKQKGLYKYADSADDYLFNLDVDGMQELYDKLSSMI